MRQQAGFSVVELLVVIGIIAVLTVAGGAGWLAFMPGYRLRTAVDDLQASIQLAKLKAIRENAVTAVRFTGTDSYRAWLDDDEDGAHDAGEEIFLERSLPADVSLHAATDTGFVQFNSRGLPTNANAMSFRLVNSRSDYLGIRTEISGSFSIQTSETGAAGTWQDRYE